MSFLQRHTARAVSVQFDGVCSCPVEVQLCTVLAEQLTRKDVLVMLQQSCRHQLCGVELTQTSVKSLGLCWVL